MSQGAQASLVPIEEDRSYDCGVVFTGGSGRIREGLAWLARGSLKKLILSGVHPEASLRDIVASLPFYGINSNQDIILERRSSTTYGNAQQAWPLIEALNCQSVLLITSGTHMYRAQRSFLAAQSGLAQVGFLPLLTPPAESGWDDFTTEVVKSVFYSLWAY